MVLDRIKEYNMKLKRVTCEFWKSGMSYVCHVLTEQGVKPDPEKVRAVKEKNFKIYWALSRIVPNLFLICQKLQHYSDNCMKKKHSVALGFGTTINIWAASSEFGTYRLCEQRRFWRDCAAKVQASLRIRAVSPEPPLLAHTSSESKGIFRQKARS